VVRQRVARVCVCGETVPVCAWRRQRAEGDRGLLACGGGCSPRVARARACVELACVCGETEGCSRVCVCVGGETEGCPRVCVLEERQRLCMEERQRLLARVCVCVCVWRRDRGLLACLCVEERQRVARARACVELACVCGETEVCSRVCGVEERQRVARVCEERQRLCMEGRQRVARVCVCVCVCVERDRGCVLGGETEVARACVWRRDRRVCVWRRDRGLLACVVEERQRLEERQRCARVCV
jgi:hypothetical protein